MHWLPEGVSTYSARIDQMFYVILVVTGIAFFLTEGLLFYFAWRYRHREGVRARYTHGNSRLEVVWTVVPAVMLVFLGLASKTVWGEIKGSIPPTDQEVVVMASQFDWEVRYKGADGQFDTADDVVIHNEMHIPLGVPTKTGDYEIACAELCGFGHGTMRGMLTVMEPQPFEEWLKQQEAGVAPAEAPPA